VIFLNGYIFITIGRVGSTTELVTQKLLNVEEDEKLNEVLRQLNEVEGKTLIFVAMKKSADDLYQVLNSEGFKATSIHGDRTQYERERALDSFKNGNVRVLVATDVAARGLHIDNVTHVINFDMPSNIDDYVHRIGRTGRCGKEGIASSFFNSNNMNIIRDLIHLLNESNQNVPAWLEDLLWDKKKNYGNNNGYNNRRGGRGGHRGGGGRSNFNDDGRSSNNWNANKKPYGNNDSSRSNDSPNYSRNNESNNSSKKGGTSDHFRGSNSFDQWQDD